MKTTMQRMRTAMVAIVIACLVLGPAVMGMPVPSTTGDNDLYPDSVGRTGGYSDGNLFWGTFWVVEAYALSTLFDNNEHNNALGYYAIAVPLVAFGSILVALSNCH
jgi:hypothetical protein